jgi:hypothetical protein
MKKILLAALIAVALGTSAFAADDKKINHAVLNSFTADFKDAENVNWKVDAKYYKATFTLYGEEVIAFYDLDNEFIGSSKVLAFDKLPKKALYLIGKNYPFPPYKLMECIEFTKANGNKTNYVSFETEKEKLILEVSTDGDISVFKKSVK